MVNVRKLGDAHFKSNFFLIRAATLVGSILFVAIVCAVSFLETTNDIKIHLAILVATSAITISVGWFWVIRPMSELIRVDAARKRLEFRERFSLMIDNMKEGVIVSGREGVMQWNRSALTLFGLTEGQMSLGEPFPHGWRIKSENGTPLTPMEMPTQRCFNLGKPISSVLRIHKPNGGMIWIQTDASPVFIERVQHDQATGVSSQVTRVITTYRDITTERNAMERFELAMKAVKLGVWDWDILTNSSKWDTALCEMFGIDPLTHTGEPFINFVHPDDRERAKKAMELAMYECRDASLEFRIVRTDGKNRVIRAETKGFYSAAGKVLRHVGVNWDITDQREQEIRALQASKMSSLGEMSAGIAHEINNPLAIIIGKAESMRGLMAREILDRDVLHRHIDVIERTAHRIAKIVRSLRAFSRDGNQDPFEPTNVAELVRETFALCNSRFLNHGIGLVLSEIAPELVIDARSVEISQVLLNLLNNAFDAVSELDEKWVRLEVTSDSTFVDFAVIDSGRGIPAAVREKMLQPFFTTKEVGQGTGLGLSIATGIAQAHAGLLTIDADCANTRILMRIPLRQAVPKNSAA